MLVFSCRSARRASCRRGVAADRGLPGHCSAVAAVGRGGVPAPTHSELSAPPPGADAAWTYGRSAAPPQPGRRLPSSLYMWRYGVEICLPPPAGGPGPTSRQPSPHGEPILGLADPCGRFLRQWGARLRPDSPRHVGRVVYICGRTALKFVFRLRLQNISTPYTHIWFRRVEGMVSTAQYICMGRG